MNLNDTYAVRAYREHRDAIPPQKWAKKVGRFFGGVVVATLTTLGVIRFGIDPVPFWAYALGYVAAGYLVFPKTMAGLKKFIVGVIKDVRAALKNGATP